MTNPEPLTKAGRSCPKCSGDLETSHYEAAETSAGCETYVEWCVVCGWQGEPE